MEVATTLLKRIDSNKKKLIKLLQLTRDCKYNLSVLNRNEYPLPLQEAEDEINFLKTTLLAIFDKENPDNADYDNVMTQLPTIIQNNAPQSRAATPSALVTQPPAQTPITAEIVKQIIDDTKAALDKKKHEILQAISDEKELITDLEPDPNSVVKSDNHAACRCTCANLQAHYSKVYDKAEQSFKQLVNIRKSLRPENQNFYNLVRLRNRLISVAADYLQQWPQPTHGFFAHNRQTVAKHLLECASSTADNNKDNIINTVLDYLGRSNQEERNAARKTLQQYEQPALLTWLALAAYTNTDEGQLNKSIKNEFGELFRPYSGLFSTHSTCMAPAIPNFHSWLRNQLCDELDGLQRSQNQAASHRL